MTLEFLENLNNKILFSSLIESFKNIFVFTTSASKALPCFRIAYTFSYKEEIDEVSAIFINDDGTITDMIDYEEEQIIPAKIRDIFLSIKY
jgi:hypothetical protein